MLAAIASLTILGLALGWLLGLAARYLKVEENPLVERVSAILPGSQCGQCGFAGCSVAAAAVVSGRAAVTLCPPGGRTLAEELASLLGVTLDPSAVKDPVPLVAHVDEKLCVGCTKCFKRCPTDAILGGPKMIHAVFADACIGCQQCYEVCPTQGIEMRPPAASLHSWYWPSPVVAA